MFDLPIHPILVHFPIATLTLAWGLLIHHYWSGKKQSSTWASQLEILGVVTLPVTIITGLWDTSGFSFLTAPRWDLPLVWHFLVALGAAVVFTTHAVLRRRWVRAGRVPMRWDLAFSTTGFWLLVFAGLLAGELVYAA